MRRLQGRRVVLFKPSFGISTPWAYGQMIARATDYISAREAEARLTAWVNGAAAAEELCGNNMEPAAFAKFIALPVLQEKLRGAFGLEARLSGSGSACFVLLAEDRAAGPVIACIRECWGPAAFVQEMRIV